MQFAGAPQHAEDSAGDEGGDEAVAVQRHGQRVGQQRHRDLADAHRLGAEPAAPAAGVGQHRVGDADDEADGNGNEEGWDRMAEGGTGPAAFRVAGECEGEEEQRGDDAVVVAAFEVEDVAQPLRDGGVLDDRGHR